jgi:hypothetical protein
MTDIVLHRGGGGSVYIFSICAEMPYPTGHVKSLYAKQMLDFG